jgi:SagB-type dehydrogenase family enzyme
LASDSPTRRIEEVRAYHAATRHHFQRYARGPFDLDWATQPDPFRRYVGAPLLPLDHAPLEVGPKYADVFGSGVVESARLDRASVSRLLLDSLALSAWKQYGDSRWALRVNPSSGNLHPTEAHLLLPAIDGLCATPILAHYAPREHGLEVRAKLPLETWRELAESCAPDTWFIALTSIHWREAWKYGERAWRYCQHDAGHAIAAVAIAAAGLGWRVEIADELSHAELLHLLRLENAHGVEREEPDVLLVVHTQKAVRPRNELRVPEAFASLALRGIPNQLSSDHVEWDAIDFVAHATRKPRTSASYAAETPMAPMAASSSLDASDLALRKLLHTRRSAVAFDGKTSIDRASFLRMCAQTCRFPSSILPWAPRVSLGFFVHRVRDLESGLYLLVRDATQVPLWRGAMKKTFAWETLDDAPRGLALFRLARADLRGPARAISCHQEIAADGAFAAAMLCEFDPALERHGAWFYPRLFWECGLVGQILYLEAEALGIRGTGIGCFFDQPAEEVFGLDSGRYRSLYHFSAGGPVEDPRLQTSPAYQPQGPA